MHAVSGKKMPRPRQDRIGIIGVGVVGTTLGVALARCGYSITGLMDRSEEAAAQAAQRIGGVPFTTDAATIAKGSQCIFITTPDDVIARTCETIAGGGGFSRGDLVLHCSGALTADALHTARAYGALVASMHPMGVFADVDAALARLGDLFFCLQGDDEAVGMAEIMVRDLGATPIRVPKALKTKTHIAACLTSNYVITLADMAADLLQDLELSEEDCIKLLLPLFQGAVGALQARGLPGALTGPIARGDVATVRKHVEALGSDNATARLYALLGLRTIPVAEKKGFIDTEASKMLHDILSDCLKNAGG